VPWAVALYTEEERAVLTVRPGITDWATIWVGDLGERLRGSSDPDRDYMQKIWPQKRRLQLEYVRNHSLWIDLQIMAKTLKTHLLDRIKVHVFDRLLRREGM
jgi:lipopolysaccharide/colanic/teichoic acid biosynthesis glycosyltransferase